MSHHPKYVRATGLMPTLDEEVRGLIERHSLSRVLVALGNVGANGPSVGSLPRCACECAFCRSGNHRNCIIGSCPATQANDAQRGDVPTGADVARVVASAVPGAMANGFTVTFPPMASDPPRSRRLLDAVAALTAANFGTDAVLLFKAEPSEYVPIIEAQLRCVRSFIGQVSDDDGRLALLEAVNDALVKLRAEATGKPVEHAEPSLFERMRQYAADLRAMPTKQVWHANVAADLDAMLVMVASASPAAHAEWRLIVAIEETAWTRGTFRWQDSMTEIRGILTFDDGTPFSALRAPRPSDLDLEHGARMLLLQALLTSVTEEREKRRRAYLAGTGQAREPAIEALNLQIWIGADDVLVCGPHDAGGELSARPYVVLRDGWKAVQPKRISEEPRSPIATIRITRGEDVLMEMEQHDDYVALPDAEIDRFGTLSPGVYRIVLTLQNRTPLPIEFTVPDVTPHSDAPPQISDPAVRALFLAEQNYEAFTGSADFKTMVAATGSDAHPTLDEALSHHRTATIYQRLCLARYEGRKAMSGSLATGDAEVQHWATRLLDINASAP